MDLSSLSDKDLMALYKKTESEISAFDNLQMAMKILLNSLYGGTANKGFRFFDNDVAETITLVGQYVLRSIQNSIDDQLNNLFKTVGHKYLIYIDTDSVVGESVISVNGVNMTIAEFYNLQNNFVKKDNLRKDFVKVVENCVTPSVNPVTGHIENKNIKYVMKHRVKKRMFRVTVGGNSVICTEDHSIIIRRNNKIVSVSPREILVTDELLFVDSSK